MSIFESKPQIFRRKVREALGRFFGKVGAWFRKMDAEFRALPRGGRAAIWTGGSMFVVLLIFAIFFLPMLSKPKYTPEEPQETVAEAIDRLDNLTQGNLTPEHLPELMEDINEQLERAENNQETASLFILKFKIFYNTGNFHDAAIVAAEVIDMSILEGADRFMVYSGLVFVYEQLGDMEQRRHFAELTVGEFTNGNVEDNGSLQYYVGIMIGIF
ncbi:MAG: DUF948 domain-containing protein [Oscillospiraceae bacterium]|jgi:uncharacterized membrane protein|nr:DUF948 domain-containing protein [Oscillospiraceae bacterium]